LKIDKAPARPNQLGRPFVTVAIGQPRAANGTKNNPADATNVSITNLAPHRMGLALNREKNAGRITRARGFIIREVERKSAEVLAESVATKANIASTVATLSGFPQVTVIAIRNTLRRKNRQPFKPLENAR
jgi:hypothetical protein